MVRHHAAVMLVSVVGAFLQFSIAGSESGEVCTGSSARHGFHHLSEIHIAAPKDGSDVWGTFSVRIEFSHRVSPVTDPPEALPHAFDVMLDGDHALQVAVKNSSRSFYLIHIPSLPEGPHLVQVALRYPGDEDESLPAWAPLERDRARYMSRGHDRPSPRLPIRIASDGAFAVKLRRRAADKVHEEVQLWKPNETAILVVDMWRFHGCKPAMLRAHELVAPMNRVISAARQRGAFIIHVPSSGVDEMAPEYPVQRARMVSAAASCSDAAGCPAARFTHAGQAMGRLPGEPELPIVGGGCDDDEPTPPAPWDDETHAQHPGIVIFPRDGLSDNGREIAGALLQGGFKHVAVMGVHANECLIKRPFGLRLLSQLQSGGGGVSEGAGTGYGYAGGATWAGADLAGGARLQVGLIRDLTDAMYDPRDPPHVTHQKAASLVVQHIERHVCPSLLSSDLLLLQDESI